MINECTSNRISFSKRIKNELIKTTHFDLFLTSWEIIALLLNCGWIINNKTIFKHLNKDYINYFRQMIANFISQESIVTHVSGGYNIEVSINMLEYLQSDARFKHVLDLFYDNTKNIKQIFANDLKTFNHSDLEKGIRHFLRALFLICGSMSNPQNSYHFAMTFRREKTAFATKILLAEIDLPSKIIRKDEQFIVYNKESQFISDFLLNIGAHRALLDFESLRVEKELRNNVNRVVNCDSANTQRIADTGVRQAALISMIEKRSGLQSLPEDLYEIALLRKENPDLSLKELGEMAQPPLGKSGIYHRLRKIEKLLKYEAEIE